MEGGLGRADPAARASFHAALVRFVDALVANFASATAAQPEDQLKAPVANLLVAAGGIAGRPVLTRTEARVDGIAGRPDLGVDADQLPVGNVELKAPGLGARPERFRDEHSRDQWRRFRALPNLIYTDGREWSLYRSGDAIGRTIVLPVDPTIGPSVLVTEAIAGDLLDLLGVFFRWQPVVPSSPPALAAMLAPLTRLLRDEVLADLQDGGVMVRLAQEWRATLFPDATDQQFADGYAQTFAYALLLARMEGAAAPVNAQTAADALDADHALLAQVLRVLGQPGTQAAIGMPVGLLERVISAVDPVRLARGVDPWLYFYEDFLAAYDPVQRRNRGVYYTPIEVVTAQVRLAEGVLIDRMGKANGYGDPSVTVLDPATGTGTYPIAVIQRTTDRATHLGGAGLAHEFATVLARNVYAFEILVGPYAVTHLRLSRTFVDAGVTLGTAGVNVFLTDTLAPPAAPGFAQQATLFQARLAQEQERASIVKAPSTYVTVVIGNPPYNRDASGFDSTGRRKGGMIRHGELPGEVGLLRDFLTPLPAAVRADHGMNLYNDYVYFLRWGIWKTAQQHPDRPAILTYITASSYLHGPGFGGVREMLRREYDEVWVIDLGGEGRGTLRSDNVFPGVLTPNAIVVAIRLEGASARRNVAATTRYRRLRGDRDQKLRALGAIEALDPANHWTVVPDDWQAPFESAAASGIGTPIENVFPWTARGIQFSRTWPVSASQEALLERWRRLVGATRADRGELLKESRDAQISRDYPSFLHGGTLRRLDGLPANAQPDGVRRVGYRSFDPRWCIADRRVIDLPRPALWRTVGERQVFLTFLPAQMTSGPAIVAHTAVPDLNATVGSNGGLVAPLYRDPAGTMPNMARGFLDVLRRAYQVPVTADDVAAYVYALLGTGAYLARFGPAAQLVVPFTADADLFQNVTAFGREMLWWGTFGERRFAPGHAGDLPGGLARNTLAVQPENAPYPAAYTYDRAAAAIHVGMGEFRPVDPQVWEFDVSGYKVVQSWLAHRVGAAAGRGRGQGGRARPSSPLDHLHPSTWAFSLDFLRLLWVIERFVAATSEATSLLDQVLAGDTIDPALFPVPTEQEREAPGRTDFRQAELQL